MHFMQDFGSSFTIAFQLVSSFDPDLAEIVMLSLKVSLSAVLFSALIGLPLGAALATSRFSGRNVLIIIVNALMGLPPVVVGLLVYLALSNAGPFGWMQLLYSPSAMIIAQTILVTPIITALTREIIEQLNGEYEEYFKSLCLTRWQRLTALLWDARYGLLTVGLAGFGRAWPRRFRSGHRRGWRGHHRRWQYRPFDPGHDHGNRTGNFQGRSQPGPGARDRAFDYRADGQCRRHDDTQFRGAHRLRVIADWIWTCFRSSWNGSNMQAGNCN